ncbi:DNRLRE domain-containing protein [Candidatus Bathyarchaeota archaeon]|nr:DNRLRE domain-containing protein [Candidatus Bathyarchaeota archaeon]
MRLPIIAMIILASGLVVTQLVTISTATSVKLGSSDDSWIEHQNPDIVYGWQDLIHVMRGSTIRRSYLKFDLSSLPPEKVLTDVRLILYCEADDSYNVTVDVHETADNWDEGNLTWNTAPTVGAFISNTIVESKFQYYSWNITSYAQTQYQGDKILSIVLKSPQDDPGGLPYIPQYHRDFRSKEMPGDDYDPYLEIEYETVRYYLTVVSPYGVPGGSGWYNSSDTAYATLDTGVIDCGNGTRRVFTSWGGDASGTDYVQSTPILMDEEKTAIANWKTEYYLALKTDPSSVAAPSGESWYDNGAYASISTDELIDIVPDMSHYIFSGWTTANMPEITDPSSPSTTILMDQPKTVTANYKTQHYLTVTSTPAGIATILGGGWHNEFTDVDLLAPDVAGFDFLNWDVDGVSKEYDLKSISITMDEPHTATAHYTEERPIGGSTFTIESPLFNSWIALNIVLITIIFATTYWRKVRARHECSLESS